MLEQSVLIKVRFSDDDFGTFEERELVFAIEDDLYGFFESGDSGEFDGHEFGGGWGTLFCYGSDADTLMDAVLPHLLKHSLPKGSYAVKRYGPPGAREETVGLGEAPQNH